MNYFPFYMETSNRTILVVGGGRRAYKKLQTLLQYEMKIHLVTKELSDVVACLVKQHMDRVEVSIRAYKDKDLNMVDYVVVATSDEGLNHWIAKSCRERRIPVNVAKNREESTFIMPAVLHQGGIDIAVSTGGESPITACYVRKKIEQQLPERLGELVTVLGECRDYVQMEIENEEMRKEAFECLLSIGMVNDCMLTKEIVEDVVKHLKNESMNE